MTRLLILTLAIIVYGSLYPWNFQLVPRPEPLFWTMVGTLSRKLDKQDFFDIVLNIFLYLPVGIFGFLAFIRRRPARIAIAITASIGLISSTAIELAQYNLPIRDPNGKDIATNVTGTLIGILLAWLLVHHRLPHWGEAVFKRPDAWLLLGCWAAYQLLPLTPNITQSGWQPSISVPHGFDLTVAAALLLYIAEALALVSILEAIAGAPLGRSRSGKVAFAGAVVVVCCKMAFAGRVLSVMEIVAMVAAGSAALVVRVRGVAYVLLFAIVFSGLVPFQFVTPPRSFNWVPFLSTLDSSWVLSVVVLMGKVFRYGAAVWLLNRAGWGWVPAMGVTGAVLAAVEFTQRYTLNHVAEITDPAMAVMMAFVLWCARDAFADYARA